MATDDGRWGRDLSADDELQGASSAGWERLELDSGVRAPSDPAAHGGGRVLGDPFDGLGGAHGELPGLELDGVGRSSRPAAAPASAPSTPEPRAALAGPEVDAIADFGPPPSNLFATIPYAVLVLTRKRALAKALFDLRRLAQTAARDRDDALIELGRALHAHRDHGALAPLATQLSAADAAGRIAGERTTEWERARDAADAQRASLSAKIEQAERAAAPHRDRETKLATQMNVRATDLRRAKARLARVAIELRNLGAAPPPDDARRQMLEAERQARRADVDAAQANVDELAPQLADARRELAVMLSAVNDLTEQQRAVDAAQKRSEQVHLSTAGEAERGYHAAVIELARQALARGAAETVASDLARTAVRMERAHETRAREVQLHEAALVAYDKPGFQRGAALLGGAAFLVVVTLLFVILR